MARWALRSGTNRVLEPSMGEGEFLRAIAREGEATRTAFETWGVELARDTYDAAIASGVVERHRAIHSDFMAVTPFDVDVVIGNPPYVRLRHIPKADAARASKVAASVLDQSMDPAGSLWMPFVLHATRFLRRGGRLAFVLPYDLTYVRYARPLWSFLSTRFGSLAVVRTYERVFPDILQDVVLLLADDAGGQTSEVEYSVYESARDLQSGRPERRASIPISRIAEGERPFLEALLAPDLVYLLKSLSTRTRPMRDLVTFNIGYVTGHKRFFHPTPTTVSEYDLPTTSLRPALTSSRKTTAVGLWTKRIPAPDVDRLFLPPTAKSRLHAGERRYIESGEKQKVHRRYKTSIREPWYVTPFVRVPDVLLPVFANRPQLLINDARYVVSNSLLAGYLRSGTTAASLAAAWYTSFTPLQVELNVHSLGGGVMVLVPREAGSIRVPSTPALPAAHLNAIDTAIRGGWIDEAYAAGDDQVLRQGLGLSNSDVDLLREGVAILRHWRAARAPDGDGPAPD
jgi:hypothetical protein